MVAILFSETERLVKFWYRGHYDKHFCENYIEFGPVVHEMSLKILLFLVFASTLFNRAEQFVQFL